MSESHEGAICERVRVPMRDGVGLSVHIYRPAAEGKFPAIMLYTPYRKGPLGAPHPFTKQGYAVVYYDVRGTGDSEGFTTDMYSAEERQDGYDMVEWLASQPWCSGSVGMWGISYGAVASLQVAMQAPPHLKAIIVRSGTDDVYTEWTNPGGSPRPYVYECYAAIMTAWNFAPPLPEECGERWADIWRERLERNAPWGIGYISHLEDGPYWRERSLSPDYDRIRCAVFLIDGWADWYHSALLRTFACLKAPRRILIGPWSHRWPQDALPGPRIDGDRECLRWFDHWLKGADNGVMDEPPVTVFVRDYLKPGGFAIEDEGVFRCENEWPPARTVQTPFYLHRAGQLEREPCEGVVAETDSCEYNPTVGAAAGMHGGGPFDLPWAMPLDQRADEAFSLTYAAEPLRENVEVTGHPRAILHVSSTAPIAAFVVKLCDVAPDGTSVLVTKGYLNAAHREPHSQPSLLEPGRAYEVEIELLACAYLFRAGHRIRVDIAGADFQNMWPTPCACVNSVYRGSRHPSRVVLPVVPPPSVPLPAPNLLPSALPLPALGQLKAPEYSVTHDIIKRTVTASYVADFGPAINTASITVSAVNPARAVIDATAVYRFERPGLTILSKSHCVTASDEVAFHFTVQAEVTINGDRHFHKSWAVSVPRRFC